MADEFVQVVKIKVDDSELRDAIERFKSAFGGGSVKAPTEALEKGLKKVKKEAESAAKETEKIGKASTEALEKGMKKVGSEAKGAVREAEKIGKATKEATKETSGLTRAFQSMKGAVTSLVGAYMGFKGVSALVGFGKGSIDAFTTQRKQEQMLDTVLKNKGMGEASGEIKRAASDIQSRTTIGDESMIAGAAELSTYVSDAVSLKRMMNLLADYSMGMTGGAELSPEAMTNLATGLGKAFDGSYEALRKKGFDTSGLEKIYNAQKLVEDIQKGNIKTDKKTGELKLSNDDKELIAFWNKNRDKNLEDLKVEALEEALEDWKGLAEEFAKTDEGKIQQLKNTIGDMREDIGRQLLPVVAGLAEKLKENLPAIQEIFQNFSDILADWGKTISDNFGTIQSFVSTVADLIGLIGKHIGLIVNFRLSMKLIGPMFKKTAVQVAQAETQLETSTQEAASGISKAAAQISTAGEQAQEAGKKVSGVGTALSALKGFAVNAIVAWSASQIEEAISAAWQYFKERKRAAEAEEQYGERREGMDRMLEAWKAYKNGGALKDINERRELEGAVQSYRQKYGADVAVPEYIRKALGEDLTPPAPDTKQEKKSTKGGTTVNNINYTNNITTDSDLVAKAIKENLRTLLTSQLTFVSRSETAKAMAL